MSGVSIASPVPKRVKKPSWLDLRLVAGVVLVLASVLIGARVVSGAQRTYRVVAVSHDLAAGSRLASGDVTYVRVRLPSHGAGVYLSDTRRAVGRQLNRPVTRGELLPAAALGTSAGLTTISVPLAEGNAPRLRSGERVQLWLSTKACASEVLLSDVTVQDVHADDSGFAGGQGQDVVLAVPPELAGRVVSALAGDGAVIRAGVLTGARPRHANDALPSLDACLARTQ